MIITKTDIEEFEERYSMYCNNDIPEFEEYVRFIGWLGKKPQIIVASGYQEYISAKNSILFRDVNSLINKYFCNVAHSPLFRSYNGQWLIPSYISKKPKEKWGAMALEYIRERVEESKKKKEEELINEIEIAKQKIKSGLQKVEWDYWKSGALDEIYKYIDIVDKEVSKINKGNKGRFVKFKKNVLRDINVVRGNKNHIKNDISMLEKIYHLLIMEDAGKVSYSNIMNEAYIPFSSANEIIEKASKLIDNPLVDSTCFISPQIWTPEHQWSQKEYLQLSTIQIMKELINNKKELATIHWKELEEIVAEILRAKGMQIHILKENPQGGRDIIARGELVPGMEIITIAIEVKHKKVIDRPEVQTALYQNRMFPALMFVTSGRFTTGVIQEAMKPENRMRLFLKDGVAIRELLHAYKFA